MRWLLVSLNHRFIASLIHWIIYSLIHWFIDSSIHWFTGLVDSLSHCFAASLIHEFTDSMIHWFIDSLVHWFIIQLCTDFFMSFHWHLNHHFLIRWCTAQLQYFIASASQNSPIGHWFLKAMSYFRNFRPARAGHYLVLCHIGVPQRLVDGPTQDQHFIHIRRQIIQIGS